MEMVPRSQHERQDSRIQSRRKRRLDSESCIMALRDQVLSAKVPQQLERIKDLLLAIVHSLEPDRKENEETVSSFVERVVQLSMTVLLLLEATDDMSHTSIEGLQQVLEDVKKFVVSANRWHSYPCSIVILRKTLTSKAEALERRLNSIINGLDASLSDVTVQVAETPMKEIPEQLCNKASSNLFSSASDFTMENPSIYSAPGGSIHLVTNHAGPSSGLPHSEDLELEREIYKRREYRLHRGRAHGRAVVVKVFQGPRAKQLCLDTAELNRSLMHSNILRMIGDPGHNSKSPFLVFDGDYVGTVESQLAMALKEGDKETWGVGANTVIGCSLGLDYLEALGLPFGLMKPEHFILLVSKQGRVVVDFDADAKWDHASNSNQWTTSQSHKTRKIFNELIEKTFYTSCKEYYRDQRLYADSDAAPEAFIDNDDVKDDDEPERRSPDPDQGALTARSASRQSPRKARGHRRELVWKSRSVTSVSLEAIAQHYEASLARFHSENMLVHRWSHSMTQVAHRCKGYKRTEITLTPDIKRCGIVSHRSPVPNEICSVCGEKVGMAEIFDCSCGFDDDNTTITLPTIKCTICSRWQHQACMKITSDTQIKRFICWRCPGGIVKKRRTRSRSRSRGSKDFKAKLKASQSPVAQLGGDSSPDENPPVPSPVMLPMIPPLISPIPHFPFLQQSSRFLRSPTAASPEMSLFYTDTSPPTPLPSLEELQKGLMCSNSAGSSAVGRRMAMHKLTGGTETYEASPPSTPPPSLPKLTRNNTVAAGERIAARQLMLSRLGTRITKEADAEGASGAEDRGGATSPHTTKRRRRRSRRTSVGAAVSDSDFNSTSTNPNTPAFPPTPLPTLAHHFAELRAQSTTPNQRSSSRTQSSERIADTTPPPLPNPVVQQFEDEEVEPERPEQTRRRSVLIEDPDDEEREPPDQRYAVSPLPGTPQRTFQTVEATRSQHVSETLSNGSSDSVPGPGVGAPAFMSQRAPSRNEVFQNSPFMTPLKEKLLTDELYPASTIRPRTPYANVIDSYEREISWVASPVPEIRMPIDDDEEDEPGQERLSVASQRLPLYTEISESEDRHVASDASAKRTEPSTTWEKVKNTFSRAGSSTGRRSRTNSIATRERRDHTDSSISRESGASLLSARTDKGENGAPVGQPQAPPLMQSPSASASILSLVPHAPPRGSVSPIPPPSSADMSKYQNAKLFPFPGMLKLEEERRKIQPMSNSSTPDVSMQSSAITETQGSYLSYSNALAQTPDTERRLGQQNVDSFRSGMDFATYHQEYMDLSPSPQQNGTHSKLPATLPGVKQWLSKNLNKKPMPTASPTPGSAPLSMDLSPSPQQNGTHSKLPTTLPGVKQWLSKNLTKKPMPTASPTPGSAFLSPSSATESPTLTLMNTQL